MKVVEDISKVGGSYGRTDEQYGYHKFIGRLYRNKTILDVGAGLGQSKKRLEACQSNTVTLQDLAPGMPVDIKEDISKIPDKSYDVVTAFDVIEHCFDDITFLAQLIRIAKHEVVVTTPNYNVSKNGNPTHYREYKPEELLKLIEGKFYHRLLLVGDGNGENVYFLDEKEFLTHNSPHQGFILYVNEDSK